MLYALTAYIVMEKTNETYYRQSNIELLRIVAMFLIVMLHTNYFTIGCVSSNDIFLSPITSFVRILCEQLCIVGVNVFILISGYFGIKPSISKIGNIMFQVLFWGVIVTFFGVLIGAPIEWKQIAKVLWGGGWYWFISAYVGLYCFAPVLNSFIENTDKKGFSIIVTVFFFLEFMYGWLGAMGSYLNGYSFVSFIGLYLLGRYIKLYPVRIIASCNKYYFLLLYLLFSLIPSIFSFITIGHWNKDFNTIAYSSPFVVGASVFLLLFFTEVKIRSRVINWIAASVLSIYLLHLHPVIMPMFRKAFLSLYNEMPVLYYFLLASILIVVGGLIVVLIDKIRIYIWDLLVRHFHLGNGMKEVLVSK